MAGARYGYARGRRAAGPAAPSLAPYTGMVATKCRIPYTSNSTNKQFNSRSHHRARASISSLQLVLPNWYWEYLSTRLETNPGSSATVSASIEYPAGTFTQVLFGGSANGTIANGGNITSDAVSVAIPDGADFWVRVWFRTTGSIIFVGRLNSTAYSCVDVGNGEAMEYGVTVSDKTMSGTITATTPGDTGPMYYPVGIIGTTTRPAIFIDGDSRTWGFWDQHDASGDFGEIARSIGPHYGYVNVGSWGEGFASANAAGNYSKRIAMLSWCSHVVSARGINALRQGGENKSAATVQGEAQTFWAKFAGKPVWHTTLIPVSASSDNWATLANQTQNAQAAQIAAFNDYVRGRPSPLAGYFELADVIESGRNSGKWKVTGVANAFTADGVHENQGGYLEIRNSGAIGPAAFT
jgi:hypothetical protein